MERRSTVYKKILDDHGKTQEGSGQYISHTIYTRNTLSRFLTTFCIGECSVCSGWGGFDPYPVKLIHIFWVVGLYTFVTKNAGGSKI